MRVKIYYHHTDCGGVIYYANYLKFLEEARTEFLAERGVLIKQLAEAGVSFVVLRQEIDYKSPAFYADTILINTRLMSISRVKIEFAYEIKNQSGKIICTAKTVMACVNKSLKPRAIPQETREALT